MRIEIEVKKKYNIDRDQLCKLYQYKQYLKKFKHKPILNANLEIINSLKHAQQRMNTYTYQYSFFHKEVNETYSMSERLSAKELLNFKQEFIKTIRTKRLRNRTKVVVNKLFDSETLITFPMVGLVHEKSGEILRLARASLYSIFNKAKLPKTSEFHIGVEIECYIQDLDGFRDKLVNAELYNKICLKRDASLNNPSAYDEKGIEICLLDTIDNIGNTLDQVMRIIKENKGRVDSTCGLHVHLDMRYKDKHLRQIIFNNLVQFQRFLFQLQSKKRRNNRFCRSNKSNIINSYSTNRFKAINDTALRKYNTFEVRVHEGTLDVNRINNWIKLLFQMTEVKERIEKKVTSRKKLFELIKAPKQIEDYVKTQIKEMRMAS